MLYKELPRIAPGRLWGGVRYHHATYLLHTYHIHAPYMSQGTSLGPGPAGQLWARGRCGRPGLTDNLGACMWYLFACMHECTCIHMISYLLFSTIWCHVLLLVATHRLYLLLFVAIHRSHSLLAFSIFASIRIP